MVLVVLWNKNNMKRFVRKGWKNILNYLYANLSLAHLCANYVICINAVITHVIHFYVYDFADNQPTTTKSLSCVNKEQLFCAKIWHCFCETLKHAVLLSLLFRILQHCFGVEERENLSCREAM
jgi:hypothetical protein